jgi:predicted metalloprotease with PDZ domain
VGLMMDAQIRVGSKGAKGMEDLFALLWQRHGEKGLTDADIRKAYQELSGLDPEPFWNAHIRHGEPLDASAIEAAYGLKFEAKAPWESLPAEDLKDASLTRFAKSYVGLEFGTTPDVPTIKNVIPGSPAFVAGLSYGQEILAVNGWRTTLGTEVQQRISDVQVDEKILFTVVERGRVKTISVLVIENPRRTFAILPNPMATDEQKGVFTKWTGQPFPAQPPLIPRPRSGNH